MTSRACPQLPPPLVCQLSWQLGAFPQDWKKARATPVLKKIWQTTGQPASSQLILEKIYGLMKDKKVVRRNQHRLKKGKWCLTDLTPFCNEVQDRARCCTRCELGLVTCLHDLCLCVAEDAVLGPASGRSKGMKSEELGLLGTCSQRAGPSPHSQ